MNKDLIQIERSVYNTFHLLGDIGGLYGLFVTFASSLLGIINFQKQENQLSSRLFKAKSEDQDENFSPDKQWALKEYL